MAEDAEAHDLDTEADRGVDSIEEFDREELDGVEVGADIGDTTSHGGDDVDRTSVGSGRDAGDHQAKGDQPHNGKNAGGDNDSGDNVGECAPMTVRCPPRVVDDALLRRAATELNDRVSRDDLEDLLGNAFDTEDWEDLVRQFGHDTCGPRTYTYTHQDANIAFVKVQYVLAYLTQRRWFDSLSSEKEEREAPAAATTPAAAAQPTAPIRIDDVDFDRLLRGSYDVIVIGNGFRENLLALMCAKEGDSVLHLTFPKALEELRNHPESSVFTTQDTFQLRDDELSSFTLTQMSALLHAFVKPTIHLTPASASAAPGSAAKSSSSATTSAQHLLSKQYTYLGKTIPTAAMSSDVVNLAPVLSAALRDPPGRGTGTADVDRSVGAEDSTSTTNGQRAPSTNCNVNVGLSAAQLGVRAEDVFNWNFRLVDGQRLARPLRGGAPHRASPVYNPHRDGANKTCYTTASVQRYHLSHSPKLLLADDDDGIDRADSTTGGGGRGGGLVEALRSVGALQFLDLVPAGVDCMWLGDTENQNNPGVRAGLHKMAGGMQPVPGTSEAALQCEALGVRDKRRLRLLLDLASLSCRPAKKQPTNSRNVHVTNIDDNDDDDDDDGASGRSSPWPDSHMIDSLAARAGLGLGAKRTCHIDGVTSFGSLLTMVRTSIQYMHACKHTYIHAYIHDIHDIHDIHEYMTNMTYMLHVYLHQKARTPHARA